MNESDVDLSNVAHETFHIRRDSFSSVPERQCTTIRSNYDRTVGHIVIEIFECPFERKSFLIIRMLGALRRINSLQRIVNRVLKTVMLLCKYIYVCSFCPPLIGLLVLSPWSHRRLEPPSTYIKKAD